ncbi:hypothetical protein PMI42_05181, partial [Bradyrhizobium sp. YR681]
MGRERVGAVGQNVDGEVVAGTADGVASHSVIASAAKQSRIPPRKDSGLLRCARNDDV